MRVWRLTKPEHAPGLDGEGARLYGGRWNSPGLPVVYTASSLALAALEVFVHLPPAMRRPSGLPELVAIALDLPVSDIAAPEELPPSGGAAFRAIGDAWLAGKGSLALRVPSQVIRHDSNILINPHHPGIARVTVAFQEPFRFDDRLGT
ncbi:MAG: RES family NAD+ phosphorylase [Rhodobacter sp.]|nr:RES family NAD+ phosphorylase [Rhodobacter sp.]